MGSEGRRRTVRLVGSAGWRVYFEAKEMECACRRFGGLRGLSELARGGGVSVGGEVTAWPPLPPLTTPFTTPPPRHLRHYFVRFLGPLLLACSSFGLSVLILSQTNPAGCLSAVDTASPRPWQHPLLQRPQPAMILGMDPIRVHVGTTRNLASRSSPPVIHTSFAVTRIEQTVRYL